MNNTEIDMKELEGKIVLMKEYHSNESRLFKERLSSRERIFRACVDGPRQLIQAIVEFINPFDKQPDMDFYVEKWRIFSPLYVEATSLFAFEAQVSKGGLTKAYNQKALDVRFDAIKACTDKSAMLSAGKLRPKFF